MFTWKCQFLWLSYKIYIHCFCLLLLRDYFHFIVVYIYIEKIELVQRLIQSNKKKKHYTIEMFIGTRNSMVSGASSNMNDMNMKIESIHTHHTVVSVCTTIAITTTDTQVDIQNMLLLCFIMNIYSECSCFTLPYSNANVQQKI